MAGQHKGGGSKGRGNRRRSGTPIVRRGTLRLSHELAAKIRAGHPWVYRDAVGQRLARERSGSTIELVDWDGDFVGRGVFDAESAIAVRVVSRSESAHIGPSLIERRVKSAIALRERFLGDDDLECMRLINAESDGLPGIVVERFGDYCVSQLYSESVVEFRKPLYDTIEAELKPKAIYEQKRFKSLAGEGRQAAELVRGSPAPVEFEVREGPLKFLVDVTAPVSTGLFPDLRDGRRVIARWAKGRRVLNLFSYTGAISVYAAHGGATEVAAVDVAAKAHARARRNFALNGFDSEAPEHIVGDAFKVLTKFADRGRKFDMVVIDPPAFASGTRSGRPWSAVKDFGELVAAALDVTETGGLLISASSTHKLSASDFDMSLADGAARTGTVLRILERCGLPVDFPRSPGFPESNYLKFAVCARD